MVRGLRQTMSSRNSLSPSMAKLQFKLKRVISSHNQTKSAFHQLKEQIKFSLAEAEDVFASLAIPLMKLVGLKTVEMAKEGRFTTIVIDTNSFQGCQRNRLRSEFPARSSPSTEEADRSHQIYNLQVERYSTKATMTGKELREKQQEKLTQLVHLLKNIEEQVNSSQNDILQTLSHHRLVLHKFFQTAISYLSSNINRHHQTQNNNDTYLITLKLLRVTFDNVSEALGSVENGVEDLMHELAKQMCNPMVEYVKGLKTEIRSGSTCSRLLATVEDMAEVMKEGKLELEDAKKKVRVAEEKKVKALNRLRKSEERVRETEEKMRKMKECLGFLLGAKNGDMEQQIVPLKYQGLLEDKEKDEKLLWELLKKKRKIETPDNPLGVESLVFGVANNKHIKPTRVSPSIGRRPVTRSYSRGMDSHTPRFSAWLPLGSSPSVATQQAVATRFHV